MPDSSIFTTGWLIFGVMAGTLLLLQFWRRQPIGLSLLGAAAAGALVGGRGIPVRHLVEGAFTYLDPILIIFTAMLFMRVLEENGSLGALAGGIVKLFGHRPVLLIAVVTFFIMFPAMLTGITTTSVLTTGALMAPALVALGLPRDRTAALVAIISVMGMLAPPVNLLAMLIGQGVDMPYIGFELPLLTVTVPIALIAAFALAWPSLRKIDPELAGNLFKSDYGSINFFTFLPPVIVFGSMAAIRLFPGYVPDIGIPLVFAIGTLIAILTGRRVSFAGVSIRALKMALPVLGLLAGVGAFLQIMTLTGVRGLLVVTALTLPPALKYAGLLISLPLLGGVSAFASSMIFGVPFLLSLLGGNEIWICAGISILAGLGDVLPPSAINARFAAQVVADVPLSAVIRKVLPYVVLAAVGGMSLIWFA